MEVDKELVEKMKVYHDALGLANAYNDLSDLLKKYEDKITRQSNQASRRNETLKKGNSSVSTRSQALEYETRLLCQLNHIKDLRIEFLQRTKDALDKLKTAKEDYIAYLEQMKNDD